MAQLKYKIIPEGMIDGKHIPINLILVDLKDVQECGLETKRACEIIADEVGEPSSINTFDRDACTTTSDGLVAEGALMRMAAADRGRINGTVGYIEMPQLLYGDEDVKREPHLKVWREKYPDRKLYMGIDYHKRLTSTHNITITGRASNNNSATEMMNLITMDEVLFPILGQLEIMRDGKVLVGMTGEIISVGIGMVVPEEYGRIIPGCQFQYGDTAHSSGEYAKTLKRDIPIICASKAVLAKYIIQSLECGLVPGRNIGAAPALLTVAKYMHKEIDTGHITEAAYAELATVGFTKEWINSEFPLLSAEEIIARADELIPGCDDYKEYSGKDIAEVRYVKC